jgi:hypothetical protein
MEWKIKFIFTVTLNAGICGDLDMYQGCWREGGRGTGESTGKLATTYYNPMNGREFFCAREDAFFVLAADKKGKFFFLLLFVVDAPWWRARWRWPRPLFI